MDMHRLLLSAAWLAGLAWAPATVWSQGPPPHAQARGAQPGVGAAVFNPAQQQAARHFYLAPEQRGFVPPGLAKKGGVPPGQRKHWRIGQPLPADVVPYALPGALVVALGTPPAGHRYVRVATDILLIAIGTGLVVDAIEDIVR